MQEMVCRQSVKPFKKKTISKEITTRCSVWSKNLSPGQINYAALDAFAGLLIYLEVNNKIDVNVRLSANTSSLNQNVFLWNGTKKNSCRCNPKETK
jgi:ribonuclease D